MDVVQRSVDGIFYSEKDFSKVAKLVVTAEFDEEINQEKLTEIKNRIQSG